MRAQQLYKKITGSGAVIAYFAYTASAMAAGPIEYVPLAPLPGIPAGAATNLNDYLNALFAFGIGMAGILAVLMIVIAGIEYMGGAASPSTRQDAKERISNALLGLLIAAVAYIILFSINPKLLG